VTHTNYALLSCFDRQKKNKGDSVGHVVHFSFDDRLLGRVQMTSQMIKTIPTSIAVEVAGIDRALHLTRQRWLLLGNIMCLDAPSVAVSWLLLLGDCFHLTVPRGNIAALFLTVWLIYLADRFVDSFSLQSDGPRSARQTFCARNRALWLSLLLLVGFVDAAVVCLTLDRAIVLRGIFLGSIVFAYLTINWSCDKIWATVSFKEAIIGFLFSTGTLLGLGSWLFVMPAAMLLAGGLFALLCFANCVSIASWERNLDRIQNKHSLATRFGTALRLGKFLAATLVVGSVFLVWIDVAAWPMAVCIAVSSMALTALNKIRICRDERTALADLVLLTPIVFLAFRSIL
jgi:hypothetical protein